MENSSYIGYIYRISKSQNSELKYLEKMYLPIMLYVCIYILKRKSFATLTKMLVPFFGSKQSLSDNAFDKSFICLAYNTKIRMTSVAFGCLAATIILRQFPIFKSHGYDTSHVMRKIFFTQYLFSKAEWKTNSNQVNLCLCQCSLRLRDVFNFFRYQLS